jgi:hypothetical protein
MELQFPPKMSECTFSSRHEPCVKCLRECRGQLLVGNQPGLDEAHFAGPNRLQQRLTFDYDINSLVPLTVPEPETFN